MHDERFKTLDDVLEFYRKGGQLGPHLDSLRRHGCLFPHLKRRPRIILTSR